MVNIDVYKNRILFNNRSNKLKKSLKDGSAIIIPANSEHNITAGDDGLKLYTECGSNHHLDQTVDKTKKRCFK